MRILRNYLQKTKSYTSTRFIIESTFIAISLKFLIGFLAIGSTMLILGDINIDKLPTPDYKKISNPVFLFFLLCIFAPIVETIIFQWFPIALLQRITSNIALIICIDATLFTFVHWSFGVIYMFSILPFSIILAYSFLMKKTDSLFKDFWITASIHALYNFSAFLPVAFL